MPALPAGLFVVLAVAASAAGWWLLVGLVPAAVLAWISRHREPRGRVGATLMAVRDWSLLAVCVAVPAAYLVPVTVSSGTADLMYAASAIGVVGLAVGADASGLRATGRLSRWSVVLLGVVAIAFVAVCVAIPPARQITTPGELGPGSPLGVVLAAVVFLPLFTTSSPRRFGVGVAAALLVAVAALYQLGPVRLGLSPTSLREALAAADADALAPALAAAAVFAGCVSALRLAGALRSTGARLTNRDPARWSGTVAVVTVGAGVWAAVFGPVLVVSLAGAVAVAEVAHRLAGRTHEQD